MQEQDTIGQDEQAVHRALGGDSRGFEELVQRHFGRVYAIAYANLRGREAAEDLAQEVFLRAYLHLGTLKDSRAFPAWLTRIARNLAFVWIRENRRSSRLLTLIPAEDMIMEIADTTRPSPRTEAAAREEQARLREAIMRLPANLRETVLLHYSEGLSQAEIAWTLGVDRSAVNRQLARALSLLRAMENDLQQAAAPLRTSQAAARSAALSVAVAAGLSETARAALVAASMDTAALGSAATSAAAAGLAAKTAAALVSAKGIAVAAVTVAVVAVSAYNITGPGDAKRNPARETDGRTLHTSIAGTNTVDGRAASVDNAERATTGPRKNTSTARHSGEAEASAAPRPADASADVPAGQAAAALPSSANSTGPGAASGGLKTAATATTTTTGRVAGRVVTADEKPISTSTLRLAYDSTGGGFKCDVTMTSASGAGGRFSFDGIPVGKALLCVESAEYAPVTSIVTVPSGDLVIKLSGKGARISGVVFDKATGQGAAHATVCLRSRDWPRLSSVCATTVTDDIGLFAFDRIPAGKYVFSGRKNELGIMPHTEFGLHEGETSSGVALFLYSGHTITGKVTEARTGRPIAGAEILDAAPPQAFGRHVVNGPLGASGAFRRNVLGVTGEDGSYRIERIFFEESRRMPLHPAKPGYALVTRYTPKVVFVQVDFDGALIACDMEMVRTIPMSGRVLTSEGEPAAGAEVTVRLSSEEGWAGSSAIADANGMFRLDAPVSAAITLGAALEGHGEGLAAPVKLTDEPPPAVEIVLSRSMAQITGTVVGPDGQPVAGAQIETAQWVETVGLRSGKPGKSGLSDSSGSFVLAGLAPVETTLCAKKPGYAQSLTRRLVCLPDRETSIQLELRAPHHLAGRVTDKHGQPLAGVDVAVRTAAPDDDLYMDTTTDANGRYRVDDMNDAQASVHLSHPTAGRRSFYNIKLNRDNADFTYAAEVPSFIGNVVDWRTKAPIAQFKVRTSRSELVPETTDKPGQFRIEGDLLPHDFRIEAAGYASLMESVRIPDGVTSYTHTFEMGPGGTIAGRLVASDGKSVVAGVKLELVEKPNPRYWDPPSRQIPVDAQGRFSADRVCVGRNEVVVTPPKPLAQQTKDFWIKQGQHVELGDIVVCGPGTIKGRLLRMPEKSPVADALVEVEHESLGYRKSVRTGADGGFAFEEVPNGSCTVTQAEHGLATRVDMANGATKEVRLEIWSSKLSGRILRRNRPVPGAKLSFYQVDNTGHAIQETVSKQDGSYEVRGLGPGRWGIDITYRTQESPLESFTYYMTLQDTNDCTRDFAVPAGCLRIKAVDASERPVVGARIHMERPEGFEPADGPRHRLNHDYRSGTDGTCAAYALLPGRYTVTAFKDGAGTAMAESIEVREEGEPREVVLRLGTGGTLLSTVLDMNGNPVANAWCRLYTIAGGAVPHGAQRGGNGVLTVPNLPPGSYTARVSGRGLSEAEHTVEIRVGETTRIDDVLSAAGTVTWTLAGADGKPVGGIQCRLVPQDTDSIEQPRTGTTDSDGVWTVRGLTPGAYRLTAASRNGQPVTATVTVTAGKAEELNGVMPD